MDARAVDQLLEQHLWGHEPVPHKRHYVWECIHIPGGVAHEVRFLSTTYEGMGLVLDAMRERGWLLTLHLLADGSAQAWFNPINILLKPSGYLREATAPAAVALAALRALGVEVE